MTLIWIVIVGVALILGIVLLILLVRPRKKYACAGGICIEARDGPFSSLANCQVSCGAADCYYWAADHCAYEKPCAHDQRYPTQNACEQAHTPAASCWCWDKTRKICSLDPACSCQEDGYPNERDCVDNHSATTKWYSFDQYKNCVENADCEMTSDRNFCVKNQNCEGAPFFTHTAGVLETQIAQLLPQNKLNFVPSNDANSKLPFDVGKVPVLTFDHECHMSLNLLPNSTEYGITVEYGKACKHKKPIDCTTQFDDDCKYGAQFWTTQIINRDIAIVSYDINIPAGGFPTVLGGKLPGIYGLGKGADMKNKTCTHCTGSHPSDGVNCWSARPMWRAGNFGQVLLVVPVKANSCNKNLTSDQVNQGMIKNPGNSVVQCDPSWGCGLARGSFSWPFDAEDVVTVTMFVQMNTPGQRDGKFYFYLKKGTETAATLVFYYDDLLYRLTPDLNISGILFSTFYGGGNAQKYQPPGPCSLTFSNFVFYKG